MSTDVQLEETRTAYEQLPRRQRVFVDEVVGGATQAAAARVAGYGKSRPDVAGSKLMAKPLVRKAVEQRRELAAEEAGVEASKVLRAVASIAYSAKTKNGDKLRALELLGKNRKLWTEKHEHTGKDGAPLPTAAPQAPVILMTPEAAKAVAQQLLAEV